MSSVHIQDAVAAHSHTVILLHGRGSSGSELAEELSEARCSSGLNLFEQFPGIRWVFPSAHPRWSSVFQEEMSEWFDTPSLSDISFNQHLQVEGLRSAVQFVLGVVEDEVRRLGSASKLVLGGISQGEATALHVLLCGRHRLGGFVGTSGWLPFVGQVEGILDENPGSIMHVSKFLRQNLGLEPLEEDLNVSSVLETPVFLGHGTDDAWVDVKLGEQVRNVLGKMKMRVSWNEYVDADQDGHWLKEPEELDDIVAFLQRLE